MVLRAVVGDLDREDVAESWFVVSNEEDLYEYELDVGVNEYEEVDVDVSPFRGFL